MVDANPGSFLVATYQTERLKTLSVWSSFTEDDLSFRPAPLARTPLEQFVHLCVSEGKWMQTMLGVEIGLPTLPSAEDRISFLHHYAKASAARCEILNSRAAAWWWEESAFFDTTRSHAWILLRRLTHSSHHRGQLTVLLRLLGRPVYSTYGPTADTGGLPTQGAETIYRYRTVEDLLAREEEGGAGPDLPGRGEEPPTERP